MASFSGSGKGTAYGVMRTRPYLKRLPGSMLLMLMALLLKAAIARHHPDSGRRTNGGTPRQTLPQFLLCLGDKHEPRQAYTHTQT